MITDYTSLKAAIADFLARSDVTASAPMCIQLAEARLNRMLKPVECNSNLTGTAGQRHISITSLNVVEPMAVFLTTDGDEVLIPPLREGTFPVSDTTGRPSNWSRNKETIVFDRPLDQAHTFRFRYRQKFALSDSSPTNWLLTNYSDVYLAASMLWSNVYINNPQKSVEWKILLDEAIPEIRSVIARSYRAVLTVDPALATIGRRYYQWELN